MRKDTKNMLGQRFGLWLVISYAGAKRWTLLCECGAIKEVAGADLRRRGSCAGGCQCRASVALRFWSKVDKTDACWSWTGSKNDDGYGRFRGSNRSLMSAHRWAWLDSGGEIPPDHELDHLCRNRACVRPSHLEIVTHKENVHRGDMPSILVSRGYPAAPRV